MTEATWKQRVERAVRKTNEAQEQFQLLAYDIGDPDQPVQVAGSPFLIPATSALALDPARRLLFVESLLHDTLHAFDLRDDQLVPLPGAPLELAVGLCCADQLDSGVCTRLCQTILENSAAAAFFTVCNAWAP